MSRVGRGGAGNYVPKEAQAAERTRAAEDIEAQRGAVLDAGGDASIGVPRSKEPDPYVRTGRGGAGNWSTAEDAEVADALEASASQSAAEAKAARPAALATTVNPADGGAAPTTRGRGGVGNYAEATSEGERQRRQKVENEREKEEQLRREIQDEVDEVIKPPGKALVNNRRDE